MQLREQQLHPKKHQLQVTPKPGVLLLLLLSAEERV